MSDAKDKKPVKVKLTIEVFEDGVPTDVVLLEVAKKLADKLLGETREEDALQALLSSCAYAALNHADWQDDRALTHFETWLFEHRIRRNLRMGASNVGIPGQDRGQARE